jgi:hypothetical protein
MPMPTNQCGRKIEAKMPRVRGRFRKPKLSPKRNRARRPKKN